MLLSYSCEGRILIFRYSMLLHFMTWSYREYILCFWTVWAFWEKSYWSLGPSLKEQVLEVNLQQREPGRDLLNSRSVCLLFKQCWELGQGDTCGLQSRRQCSYLSPGEIYLHYKRGYKSEPFQETNGFLPPSRRGEGECVHKYPGSFCWCFHLQHRAITYRRHLVFITLPWGKN